jgi:hypothetical protein
MSLLLRMRRYIINVITLCCHIYLKNLLQHIHVSVDFIFVECSSPPKIFLSDLLGSHWMDFHESLHLARLLYRYILLGRRKVSDKSCRGNQNTHFMANNFFPESHALYEIITKNAEERTDHGRLEIIWRQVP